jgi:hypothetical protein
MHNFKCQKIFLKSVKRTIKKQMFFNSVIEITKPMKKKIFFKKQ